MDFNFSRRYFLSRLYRAGLAGWSIPYILSCAHDSEEALIIRLNVTQPVSGDKICVGGKFPIRWQLSGQTNLNIEISKDNGATWEQIFTNIPPTQNEILWQAPNAPIDNLLFRFVHATEKRVLYTTGTFSVTGPSLRLKTQFTNETILTGQVTEIQWESSCIETVTLEYSINNGLRWNTIEKGIPAKSGKYAWVVPMTLAKLAKLRVASEASTALNAVSEGNFTILPQVRLALKNYPELAREGGVVREEFTYFGSIAIIRLPEDAFHVMSLTCTHQGCGLETMDKGESWQCPCHIGTFDKVGCIMSGPAERPLDLYEHQYDKTKNELIITFKVIPNDKSCG